MGPGMAGTHRPEKWPAHHCNLAKQAHTGYIKVIMQGKCERNTETTFDIKWVIGTYGRWKNQNPGGRFGATS